MTFKRGKVHAVVPEAPGIKTIYFSPVEELSADPGQFLMVFVPGKEEIPISLSGLQEGVASITVAEVGDTSRALASVSPGDTLFYRGPFGRGFDISEGDSFLLVGGGYGVAPLVFALDRILERGKSGKFVVGARSEDRLILLDRIPPEIDVVVATEDGSRGIKGTAVDAAKGVIEMWEFDWILGCGPEAMLAALLSLSDEYGIPIQLSLERLMKCGIGICGSCVLDPKGLLVCRDGPVFTGEELRDTYLGRYARDWAGRLRRLGT